MEDKITLLADLFEEGLTDHQKEIFQLCREGWSTSQIAHKLKISRHSVKQTKYRIRKKIKKLYILEDISVNDYCCDTGIIKKK